MSAPIKVLSAVFPEKQQDPNDWYINNKVGYKHCSISVGLTRFIDRLHTTDLQNN